MTFKKLFHKCNSSIRSLSGNVLESTVECARGNIIAIDTGMRPSFLCPQNESRGTSEFFRHAQLKNKNFQWPWESPIKKGCLQYKEFPTLNYLTKGAERERLPSFASHLPTGTTEGVCSRTVKQPMVRSNVQKKHFKKEMGNNLFIGVQHVKHGNKLTGRDFHYIGPKSVEKISKRKLVWTDLTKMYRAHSKNRVKGFILNSVNGGYAIAVAGYIAFLPKSLCLEKKVFPGQWRQFAIVNMNPKIANIVVREIKTNLRTSGKRKLKSLRNSQKFMKDFNLNQSDHKQKSISVPIGGKEHTRRKDWRL